MQLSDASLDCFQRSRFLLAAKETAPEEYLDSLLGRSTRWSAERSGADGISYRKMPRPTQIDLEIHKAYLSVPWRPGEHHLERYVHVPPFDDHVDFVAGFPLP